MVKRKRGEVAQEAPVVPNGKTARFAPETKEKSTKASKVPKTAASIPQQAGKSATTASKGPAEQQSEPLSIQVVTGSYERVLHGFAATISGDVVADAKKTASENAPTFSDTFMFAAHSSALKSLALSPPTEAHKRILASGSTDERINLFFISTSPPSLDSKPNLPSLSNTSIVENPRNRELGSLLHHSSSVNKLYFPTKGKLFSAADDNTIAISRTRDWTVLSTIKVPIPKAQGRPSGDTAGPGEVPAGVNDFAIHPSMKVMVSVSKGEKSMRLWNLVTGKKAGVLNFDRDLLQAVGETRYSSGEGRKVLWSDDGEDYVVGFERGAVIYGMVRNQLCQITFSWLTNEYRILFQKPSSAHPHPRNSTRCDSYLPLPMQDPEVLLPCQRKMEGYCSTTFASSARQRRRNSPQHVNPSLSSVVLRQDSVGASKTLRSCKYRSLRGLHHRHHSS